MNNGDNVSNAEGTQDEEAPTELVMKKEGDYIMIWAVVDGHEIFHAQPPVTMAKGPVQAAVQTFMARGWEREFNEMLGNDDDSNWLRGLR